MGRVTTHLANGAAQALAEDLTHKVLQTREGQQALAATATAIVRTVAGLVGIGTTAVTVGPAIATVAAPVVVVWAVIIVYGQVFRMFIEFLDTA